MYALSLCLIARDEEDYLQEWVDYHILVGVEHFYIYDNESKVKVRQVLDDYIRRGWVTVMDIAGFPAQLFAYDHCLQMFGHTSRWMGFIDADEVLVPKTTTDLRELLAEYEPYGGLAVSSLFFGSGGCQHKPQDGQIAAFRLRTPEVHPFNRAVKCIVQPSRVLLPDSPHGFTFRQDFFCVNENGFRVDDQLFPNHVEKVQLNHYFCRSLEEMESKLARGRGGDGVVYTQKRFIEVEKFSQVADESVFRTLRSVFALAGHSSGAAIEEPFVFEGDELKRWMHEVAMQRQPPSAKAVALDEKEVARRPEMVWHFDRLLQMKDGYARGDFDAARLVIEELMQKYTHKVILYTSLAAVCFGMQDVAGVWNALSTAWQIAPGSYEVLRGLGDYFMWAGDYFRAENAFYAMLAQGRDEVDILGRLALALLRQGKMAQAAEIGVPVLRANRILPQLKETIANELLQGLAEHLRSVGDVERYQELCGMARADFGEGL
ncbi:MAG: glycosyltransferase family 92 protein [Anaerolineae bacterium]|nr:glycosyltransferase family 92 protein [Anaerolineae bacterium]